MFSQVNRLLRVLFAFGVSIVAACSISSPSSSPQPHKTIVPEPISFPLQDFTLTERSGAKVSKSDLLGKVWVASFIFTRCSDTCPHVAGTVARLQAELVDEPDVLLVTITVDPNRDNPAELREYAKQRRADSKRWLFLTGDEKEIHRLLRESFKVGVSRNENGKKGEEFDHSTRLAVVDRQGNVRGFFAGMADPNDPTALDEELKKLKELVSELVHEDAKDAR